MASETLGAEELPRERHRWSENSKVYTRRYKNKNNNVVKKLDDSTTTTTTSVAAAAVDSLENENTIAPNDNNNNETLKDNNVEDNHVFENGITANNNSSCSNNSHNNDDNEKNNEVIDEEAQKKVSSPPELPVELPVEEANSSQPHHNSPRVGTVSGDSSSLNRYRDEGERFPNGQDEGEPLPNGHDENLTNGLVLRPLVTHVDDRLSISVSGARSKGEVKDLKRKLVGELDKVRKMAKKLEEKEIQISRYEDVETTVPLVGHLQYPVNGGAGKGVSGGLRMISETGSVSFNESRPFRQLSVSVLQNNHHGVGGEIVEKEKRTPKANQYYRNSEFLLGKDRLPPAESNRKSKSSGGKRHGGGEMENGFRIDKKLFSKCSSLLQKIMNHKHGWVFNQPVDVKRLGLHDYFDIIKQPMDLGTVKARLTKNWYKTPREFAEDVRLTFHNALTYNPPGQDVHIMATELLGMFEEKWPAIESEYERKLRYEMIRDLPTPTSRKTYAPAHGSVPMSFAPPPLLHPPPSYQEVRNLERSQSMPVRPESRPKPAYSVGRKPVPKKPKAKDLHKRDMTFEEKQKLSTHLQSLPSEKLDAIVQIIKKRNSALSQHDDEIEVDIDSVDAETLWELDRFVTNYKKSLSKHKRRAELAQARAAAAQAAQETIQAPATVEAPRETTADKGHVATSPRVQQERHSENESGSSGSSSSSSDSGSSSDSDSDSSSGSESDGGH
ncbi:transcription factor GTE4 [Spinacia oleracea]|uniref:Transcription factor GTE4 n=1 Tax=Spinacia oleracea TaxID=3562 RepID=A0A9R0II58_SPIOL|nr:transcription factor GTE4-like [Spinacia oleracea]